MTTFFIILLLIVFLVTSLFYIWLLDGFSDEWIGGLLFGLFCAFYSYIFIALVVAENGCPIAEKVSEGKLNRLPDEKDVCFLVEDNGGYHFHTGDSAFQKRSIACRVEYIEETDSPRMECYSTEPKTWALLFFKSDPFLPKEKYVLYVPKKYVINRCIDLPVEYY